MPDYHRRRLEYHIQLLQALRPEFLHSVGNLHEYAHGIEVIEEDGNLIAARSVSPEGIRTLLPQEHGSTLIQHQRTAIQLPFERGVRFIVLSGIGVGHALLMVQAQLEKQESAGALVWESDPYAWTAFFALFDAQRAIENTNRVFLFYSDTLLCRIGDWIRERYWFLFPAEKIAYLLGALPVMPKYTERYVQEAKSLASFLNREHDRFAPVVSEFLRCAQKVDANSARSIWSCVSRDSYIHFPIAQAFLKGFAEMGFSTFLQPHDRQFGRNLEILGNLFEKRPDIIFSINLWPTAMLYDLGLQRETIESLRLIRIGWFVDDTLLYADEGPLATLGENDFVFCCDRSYLPRVRAVGAQGFFMPHATIFSEPGQPRDEYRAEVSYVGSLPDVQRFLLAMPSVCREMVERVEILRNREPWQSFRTLFDRLEPSVEQRRIVMQTAVQFGKTTNKGFRDPAAELEYFLYNTSTYGKRLAVVTALLPLGLRVYGPDSWRESLPNAYRGRYGGFIANRDLADCYASSKLCLNIHSHQCPTCLNPRDFDVPMAGSVVLGDWVEDAERGFLKPGEEFLTYRTLDECVELVHRYAGDDEARERIRVAGQKRVRSEHTYQHRAAMAIRVIRGEA